MQITGVVLNIIGLAITAVAVLREGRRRRAPLLTDRQKAAFERVRGLFGRSARVHAVTATAEFRVGASLTAYVQSPRLEGDSIEEQLQKIEKNFEARIGDLESRLKGSNASLGSRIDGLQKQHDDLGNRVAAAEVDDRDITGQSMRWELLGICLALLGTTLSIAG